MIGQIVIIFKVNVRCVLPMMMSSMQPITESNAASVELERGNLKIKRVNELIGLTTGLRNYLQTRPKPQVVE